MLFLPAVGSAHTRVVPVATGFLSKATLKTLAVGNCVTGEIRKLRSAHKLNGSFPKSITGVLN